MKEVAEVVLIFSEKLSIDLKFTASGGYHSFSNIYCRIGIVRRQDIIVRHKIEIVTAMSIDNADDNDYLPYK